ncbi:MAG: tetratricopeptide repeat protein [Bdellovibrionota bacterium]
MNKNRIFTSFFIVAFALAMNGCLKTRSQIRGNDQAEGQAAEDGSTPGGGSRYEFEEVKNELTRISGKVENLEHAQRQQNAGELKEYVTRIDERVSQLESNQVLIMTELKALKEKETAAQATSSHSVSDLLAEGHRLLAQRDFEGANEKFQAAINKGAKGKDLAEAQFGLGEVEYGQKQYKRAIVNYSKVQETSSKSPRVPASLYKMGMSFHHLEMAKEAKGFFKELIERFPRSAEAKKAKARVKE